MANTYTIPFHILKLNIWLTHIHVQMILHFPLIP